MASLKTLHLCKACKNVQPGSPEAVMVECGLTVYTRRLLAGALCGSWSDRISHVEIPRDERAHVVACDNFIMRADRAEAAQ